MTFFKEFFKNKKSSFKCPRCNGKINKNLSFCVNCGFNINGIEERNKEENTSINDDVEYVCSNCGAEISDDMRFCLNCGMEIDFINKPLSIDSNEFETVFETGEIKTIDLELDESTATVPEENFDSTVPEENFDSTVREENFNSQNMNSYFKNSTKF